MASIRDEPRLPSSPESPHGQDVPSYPFPFVRQEDGDMARLEADLTAMARRYELFDEPRKLARSVECVMYYVRYCSPPAAPLADLRIAGRFLLAFIFLNDFNDGAAREDFPAILSAFLATVNGHPASGERLRPAWLEMISELRDDLTRRSRENGVPLATLLHLLRLAYSAFHWEWSHKGTQVDPESFEAYRSQTIFNKPWIELWRVLSGIDPGLSVPASPDLAEVETLAAEITYLVNDLASLQRDVQKVKPNIVFVVRDRQGTSLADAALETRRIHDRKVERFQALCAKLEVEEGSTALTGYLDLMKIALRGNIQVIQELRRRYDALGVGPVTGG